MVKDIKPTKEQIKKSKNIFVLEETIKAGQLRLRNRGSSVYDRYYQRKEINNEQFQAASMYYKSYYIGHEKTSIIPKYKERLGGGSIPTLTPNEHQEHHRQMYEKARKSLPKDLRGFVDDVVLWDRSVKNSAKNLNIRATSGFDMFKVCLTILSDFYLDIN
tara:strand:+ start:1474 stop:1956 length:483 start_codon:yes stop_codon:yes gene_type:complete